MISSSRNVITCFQIIKAALDELYNEIPEYQRDDEIKYALRQLRFNYKYIPIIDYSDQIIRFSYLYCYVAAHANAIFRLIEETPALRSLFDLSVLHVSSLGGGPGSDLLGAWKFMKLRGRHTKLISGIYDKEEKWEITIKSICSKISNPFYVRLKYLDITTSMNKWLDSSPFFDAQLFTMSFFVSEVYSMPQAKTFFLNFFKKARSGSMFIFIDRIDGCSNIWFDNMITMYNDTDGQETLEIIKSANSHEFLLESSEQKSDLGDYFTKFCDAGQPKLNLCVNYRICRKL